MEILSSPAVKLPWTRLWKAGQSGLVVDDVVMVAADAQVTTEQSLAPSMQVAQGQPVSDDLSAGTAASALVIGSKMVRVWVI